MFTELRLSTIPFLVLLKEEVIMPTIFWLDTLLDYLPVFYINLS